MNMTMRLKFSVFSLPLSMIVLTGSLLYQCSSDTAGSSAEKEQASIKVHRGGEEEWTPKRVNKCIELLEMGQPIYYDYASGGYKEGLDNAQTWADYIVYNMEHAPLDFGQLREFMRGLVDGGPTPSGHRKGKGFL